LTHAVERDEAVGALVVAVSTMVVVEQLAVSAATSTAAPSAAAVATSRV